MDSNIAVASLRLKIQRRNKPDGHTDWLCYFMRQSVLATVSRDVSWVLLWRLRMRTLMGSLGLVLVVSSLGIAQQQQHDSDACGFAVQGESRRATVAGPDDIVPLVYVVEQPDSPIEILSVDLQGMWLSVSNDRHAYQDCAKYQVHNRSNRVIQQFDVELMVSGISSGGGGSVAHSSSPLAPDQTVEIRACGGRGHGGAPGNHVRLLVSVRSVDFGDCLYRASLRIPRSLGVHPFW